MFFFNKLGLKFGNLNGVSQEYLLNGAKLDDKQSEMINSIFKKYDDGDGILDNSEWQTIQQDLNTYAKDTKEGKKMGKGEAVKFFKSVFGGNEKKFTLDDLQNFVKLVSSEDDDILDVQKKDNFVTIQYKNGTNITLLKHGNEFVKHSEVTEQNGVKTTKLFDESGEKLLKETIYDANKNTTIVKEAGENGKLIQKEFSGMDDGKLFRLTVSENIDGKSIETTYLPSDIKMEKPVFVTTNKGQPDETVKTYYYDGDDYSAQTRDVNNKLIKSESYTKTEEGSQYSLQEGVLLESNYVNQKIIYDKDGNIKEKLVRNVNNETGEWSEEIRYDKDGNMVKNTNFQIDGNITRATQGNIGDCYFLATLNTLAGTKAGQKILHDNIEIGKDDKGNALYTITFPGAKLGRASLMKNRKISNDKIFIQEKYTITAEEFSKAAKKFSASSGDGDVLLYELAFAKYREDVNKTVESCGINPDEVYNKAGLQGAKSSKTQGIAAIDDGGYPTEVLYVVTGKKSEDWWNGFQEEERKGIYIDRTNRKMYPASNVIFNYEVEAATIDKGEKSKKLTDKKPTDKQYKITDLTGFAEVSNSTWETSQRDKIINTLIYEAKRGNLDKYAPTASFNVAYKEGDAYGAHALAIVDINSKEVKVVDSNDSTGEPYTLSMKVFKECLSGITMAKIVP